MTHSKTFATSRNLDGNGNGKVTVPDDTPPEEWYRANPVQAARWAVANANNETIDTFGNNCANFVSHALDAGGLGEKMDGWAGTLDDDNWGRSAAGEVDWVPGLEGKTHTKSWYNSDSQREFFLHNGGQTVPPDQAMPGDVIYFNYAQPNESGDYSHHAALVTGILPDGQVLYTQHTPGAANYSMQDRLPMIEQGEGAQTVTIVRPRETW